MERSSPTIASSSASSAASAASTDVPPGTRTVSMPAVLAPNSVMNTFDHEPPTLAVAMKSLIKGRKHVQNSPEETPC